MPKEKLSSDPKQARLWVNILYLVFVILMSFGGLMIFYGYLVYGIIFLLITGPVAVWLGSSKTIRDFNRARTVFLDEHNLIVDGRYSIGLERVTSVEPFVQIRQLRSFKITLRSEDVKLGKTIVFVVWEHVMLRKYRSEENLIKRIMDRVEARKEELDV